MTKEDLQDIWKNSIKPWAQSAFSFLRWCVEKVLAGILWLAVAFPIPTAAVAAGLIIVVVIWAFWPSGDSINQKKADNASEKGVTKTVEIGETKNEVVQTETNSAVAEEKVAEKAATTKTHRERVRQAEKASRKATKERESIPQPIDSKVSEVIANCKKVYERCE